MRLPFSRMIHLYRLIIRSLISFPQYFSHLCLASIKLFLRRFCLIETRSIQLLDFLQTFLGDLFQVDVEFRFWRKKALKVAAIQPKQLAHLQSDHWFRSIPIRINKNSFAKVITVVQMVYLCIIWKVNKYGKDKEIYIYHGYIKEF